MSERVVEVVEKFSKLSTIQEFRWENGKLVMDDQKP